MNRWAWFGIGAGAFLILIGRRSASRLGSPVQAKGAPQVTPNGYFGAHRGGPPAHMHQGVDLAAPAGSQVLAIGDGRIVKANPGLGKIVRKLELDRPGRWSGSGPLVRSVVYADLGTPLVEPGNRVRMGQPIALVAPAGFVHFAVRGESDDQFFDSAKAGFAYRASTKEVHS